MQASALPATRKAAGVLLVLLAAFLALSRLTFDPGDVAVFAHPPHEPAANACGWLGAHLASAVLLAFGEAYWALPLLALYLCYRLLRAEKLSAAGFLHGLMLSLPVFSLAIYLFNQETPPWAPSYGGVFATFFGDILLEHLGRAGTWLLVVAGLALLYLSLDLGTVLADAWALPRLRGPAPAPGAGEPALDKGVEPKKGKGEPILQPPIQILPDPAEEPEGTGAPARPAAERKASPALPPGVRHASPIKKPRNFALPPDSILDAAAPAVSDGAAVLKERGRSLEEMFEVFKVGCKVVGMRHGPTITQFELALEEGVRVNKVTSLSNEVAMKLKAQSVRFVAPIPGRDTVGIEVPNIQKQTVNLRSVLEHPHYKDAVSRMVLPMLLGKDVVGEPLISDLTRMPHLLVAGTTGSGKSVCINGIIVSLLLHHSPESVRLILIDPKVVEMHIYEDIPHLLTPVVDDTSQAASILEWACTRMDERYNLLSRFGAKDIRSFNKLPRAKIREVLKEGERMEDIEWPMPYFVIVVDELSDLMLTGAKEVEIYITRLAQKSRAVGIHVILATQRPSVDVITGLIKANMPTRIAFHVTSAIDSRTILDQKGAEKLLGSGDMLLMPPGSSSLVRAQGIYVSDDEIKRAVEHWKKQGEPEYEDIRVPVHHQGGESRPMSATVSGTGDDEGDDEELYPQAVRIVMESGRPSASFVQRQLKVGYNKSSRLVEMMEERGLVSPARGSGKREIMVDAQKWLAEHGGGTPGAAEEEDEQG